MSQTRAKDQTVDAFSIPRELLTQAKVRAAAMKMTRSGFYRFCLAKELGYDDAAAKLFAEHRAVLNSVERCLAGQPAALNDRASSASGGNGAGKPLVQKAVVSYLGKRGGSKAPPSGKVRLKARAARPPAVPPASS